MKITDRHIAIEVPDDATNFTINSSNKYDILEYFTDEKKSILLKGIQGCNIIGITPLSWEQCVSMTMECVNEEGESYYKIEDCDMNDFTGWGPDDAVDRLLSYHGITDKKLVIIEIE